MIETARAWLEKRGLGDRVIIFDVSSATVALAAEALGVEPGRIAKSLSFYGEEGEVILVLAAGDRRIDNGKFKATFGRKAKMLEAADVEPLTGHAPGGVCPFGCAPGVRVWLDESLKEYDIVYPACGGSNTAVRLTVEELCDASAAAGWVDVTK